MFSFLRKKKTEALPLVGHRQQLNSMADELLRVVGVDFDQSSQLDQALIGTFFFGMLQAHCLIAKLVPPQVHALAIAVYQDALHYTPQAAIQAVQQCIDATDPQNHPAMNAIIHRGIDGHQQFISGNLQALAENLNEVLAHYRPSEG